MIAAPKPFRIVFPEGFTRKQMAARVTAVAKIAQRERGKRVRLKEQAYLAATAHPRRQPGFGAKAYPLEGFLFPATYDFTARDDLAAARRRAAEGVPRELGEAEPRLRALEEPDRRTTC